jgi:hypothetical protein
MTTRFYRLTVVACALSWFMLGLHVPVLYGLTHGHSEPWSVIVATGLLGIMAVAGLWALLRFPTSGRTSSDSGSSGA